MLRVAQGCPHAPTWCHSCAACRVRLHCHGFHDRTPPSAMAVASAISSATTWNDGSMSYKVESVERAQLLETWPSRSCVAVPCAGAGLCNRGSPSHIRVPHSAGRHCRPRGRWVVARADHCTGGHRCAWGRLHRRGGDHSTTEATPALESPWTRSVCCSPRLTTLEMRPNAVPNVHLIVRLARSGRV